MNIIGAFFRFITSPFVFIPTSLLFLYLAKRNFDRVNQISEPQTDSVLLLLEIPKTNDKSELAAEQLFASLHGILRDAESLRANGSFQEHLSFEIASSNGQIRFFVWVPTALQSFVEGQIYAQYPTAQIKPAGDDYAVAGQHSVIHTAEIELTEVEYLPIRTFNGFEVDPLAGITGTLAKMEDSGEDLWVQILIRPIADSWHKDTDNWISSVKDGTSWLNFDWRWFAMLIEALWKPPEPGEVTKKELSDRDKTRVDEAAKKATKLGFKVKIRLAYRGEDQTSARLRMQALVGTFKQFNSTNLNGFKMARSSFDLNSVIDYQQRRFDMSSGFILNIEELASVWHLPHTNVETPNIVWASTKTAEPPAKLPVLRPGAPANPNVSAFGLTNFRGVKHQFGMLRGDRSRHMYIIGQTGSGKSGLLELMTLSDIYHNQGYAVIDPHGDFAINNMKFIPERRIKDVVYFNPADTTFPLGFNPLEISSPDQRVTVSSEVIGVLKRMFGDSWGPRLEHILRFTILALLERPETTMLDITRMLTDKNFRRETLHYVTDTVTLQFWKSEFASWNEKYANEAVAPVLNKVGAFTANSIIRNIIGQPKSTFNIRQIMDEGKILVVNLSKGLIGEDNAGILGAFLVTKIQLAAMSRSDIPNIQDRRPFYLYVDEFQNFATDSFATILSEARKYGLNLTVANQYISQMEENVRDAVFGNVGSIVSFRVSADDAPILAKQFEPQFESGDLLAMHNRSFIISMIIGGEKQPAFSATTLTLPTSQFDFTDRIVEYSRRHYSRPREDVEKEISDAIQIPEQFDTPARQRFRQANNQPQTNRRPPFDPTKVSPRQAKQMIQPVDRGQQPKPEGKSAQQPSPAKPTFDTNALKNIKQLFNEQRQKTNDREPSKKQSEDNQKQPVSNKSASSQRDSRSTPQEAPAATQANKSDEKIRLSEMADNQFGDKLIINPRTKSKTSLDEQGRPASNFKKRRQRKRKPRR